MATGVTAKGRRTDFLVEIPRWRLNVSIKTGFFNFRNISIILGWREYMESFKA